METLPGKIIGELLSAAPRPLQEIKAELLILDGQYLLHTRDGSADKYKFLSPATVRSAFASIPIDFHWLSSGIVRVGSNQLGDWAVLFVPPKKHQLNLGKANSIKVTLPGLAFFGCQNHYQVWAMKGSSFDPNNLAFRAPLPNVWINGSICWGNVHPPQCNAQNITAAWNLFINSSFNGDLASNKSKSYPEDVRELLCRIEKKTKFPYNELISYQLPIGQIIEETIKC